MIDKVEQFLRRWRQIVGVLALGSVAVSAAAAIPQQSLPGIASAVGDFVRSDRRSDRYPADVRVGRLDPRLRLRRCDHPLQVSYANTQRKVGQIYTSVACEAPVTWRIYVPVVVAAYGDVLVTRNALPRGHRLKAADVQLEKRDLSTLRQGFFSEINNVQSLQTKRAIAAGHALTPAEVAPVKLVRNGEMVQLVSASRGVQVAARGKALADGAEGHTVRVRNLSSGRVIEGRVVGPGRVEVR